MEDNKNNEHDLNNIFQDVLNSGGINNKDAIYQDIFKSMSELLTEHDTSIKSISKTVTEIMTFINDRITAVNIKFNIISIGILILQIVFFIILMIVK